MRSHVLTLLRALPPQLADAAHFAGSSGDRYRGPRLAVERTHAVTLQPDAGEPAFVAAAAEANCVLNSAGGFALGMPTRQPINSSHNDASKGWVVRKNLMSGLLIIPAKVKSTGAVECELPTFGSAGNTSVCVVLGPVDPWAEAPPAHVCNVGAGNTTYAPAYFSRFALFSPQFSRRPFIREANGSVLLLTDSSLRNQALHFSASIGDGATKVEIAAPVTGGAGGYLPPPES